MKVITIKPHEYGGKLRIVGDAYDMEERWVAAMIEYGNVRKDDSPIQTRDIEAAKPNRYRRRDLKAD